ncbi:MAG: DUF1178 family protein [Rhodobacteraceae bacterium]|nr:DUF1178 family protein [Paracoccaceae bacterium]TVR46641.1 MAG: DUF1178 family protein [Paracoccaceae bacterium]
MIKFTLRCSHSHEFESWFQSGSAFDALKARDMVACPVCGSTEVEKALMAPSVAKATEKTTAKPPAKPDDMADKIRRLRAEIEARSDYVGTRFASEARAMYLGDIPDRAIYGEARPEEAKALIDDGVPVLPLPFVPRGKTN